MYIRPIEEKEPIFSISLLVTHLRYIIDISTVKRPGGVTASRQFTHFFTILLRPLFILYLTLSVIL